MKTRLYRKLLKTARRGIGISLQGCGVIAYDAFTKERLLFSDERVISASEWIDEHRRAYMLRTVQEMRIKRVK